MLETKYDYEKQVIGGLMLSQKSAEQVRAFLRPEHFVTPAYAELYQHICEELDNWRASDLITAKNFLVERGWNENTATEFVVDTVDAVISTPHTKNYAQRLFDNWKQRELARRAQEIAKLAQKDLKEATQAANRLLDGFMDASQQEWTLEEAIHEAENVPVRGLETGFEPFDKNLPLFGGIPCGELTFIGANTGVGKTLLSLQIAGEFCKRGYKGVFASYEMSRRSLVRRMIQQESSFASRRHAEKFSSVEAYLDASEMIAGWDMPIFDPSHRFDARNEVEDLVGFFKMKHENEPQDFLIVDYIQLLKSARTRGDAKFDTLDDVAKQLKRLANDTNAAVIAVAQIKPNGEGLPQMRGSLSMTDHAAFILYLLKKTEGKKEDQVTYPVAYIEKARDGLTKMYRLHFDEKRIRFEADGVVE